MGALLLHPEAVHCWGNLVLDFVFYFIFMSWQLPSFPNGHAISIVMRYKNIGTTTPKAVHLLINIWRHTCFVRTTSLATKMY